MGADIYFTSRCNERKAEADEKAVPASERWDFIYTPDRYFRDSYNPTSLYWLLDRSWWQDVNLLRAGIDEDEDRESDASKEIMLANQAKYLADFRVEAETFEVKFDAWLLKQRGAGEIKFDDADNSEASWKEMFQRKLTDWIALQEAAVEAREVLSWSV